MYILYTAPRTRGTRVTWTLEELGVDYQLRLHAPLDPEILKLNPLGKLPVLVHDELVLTESAAICTYLADRHRHPRLSPDFGTSERALFNAWNFFTLTDLEASLWNYSKNHHHYPEKIRVPEILPACRREFARSVNALQASLGERPFLLGNDFSVADILCGHTLAWARVENFDIPPGVVQDYADRVLGRPALKQAIIREKQAARKDS
jgi:glutathione S-transferase